MKRRSEIDAIKNKGDITTSKISEYAGKLEGEIGKIKGVLESGVSNEADLRRLKKIIEQGTAYAEAAMEKLADKGVAQKDQKALFSALDKFDQLHRKVFKNKYTKTLMNKAGVNSTDQKRFTQCVAQIQQVSEKILKDSKITTYRGVSPIVLTDGKGFKKCIKFLESDLPNKTLKRALLNLKTADGKTLVNELLDQELKVGGKSLQDWIYDTKLYGNTKDKKNLGIKTALHIEKEEKGYKPESEPTMSQVEKYSHFIDSAVSHKTDITIDDLDVKQLNADSLEKLFKFGQVRMKDVYKKLHNLPVESLQAKAPRTLLKGAKLGPVKTVSETFLTVVRGKTDNEKQILITGILEASSRRANKAEPEKQRIIYLGVEAFMRDALIRDLLTAKNIEYALENGLISVEVLEKWGKEGIITEQVLDAKLNEAGNTLQSYLVHRDIRVGKKQERIANWLDVKYPTESKDYHYRDYDIKELQNKILNTGEESFNDLSIASETELMELEEELKSEYDNALNLLADTISSGVKKDLKEKGRTSTVLNELYLDKDLSVEIFEVALRKVTEKEFDQLTTRLKPETLKFIVQNNIPIGPNQKHPLLVINNVDMSKSQDYDYMIDQLTVAHVDDKGKPVTGGEGTSLIGYMHNSGFKFKGDNAEKIQGSADEIGKIEEKLLNSKSALRDLEAGLKKNTETKESLKEGKQKVSTVILDQIKQSETQIKEKSAEITALEKQLAKAKQGSIGSPFTDKDPLNVVINSGLTNDDTITLGRDISAKDILSRYSNKGPNVVKRRIGFQNILQQRAKSGHLVEVMCELIAEGNKKGISEEKKSFLAGVYKACQQQIVEPKKTEELKAFNDMFSELLKAARGNKNILLYHSKQRNKAAKEGSEVEGPTREEIITAFFMQEFNDACKTVDDVKYLDTGHKELDGPRVARIIGKFAEALHYAKDKIFEGVDFTKGKLGKAYNAVRAKLSRNSRVEVEGLDYSSDSYSPPNTGADSEVEIYYGEFDSEVSEDREETVIDVVDPAAGVFDDDEVEPVVPAGDKSLESIEGALIEQVVGQEPEVKVGLFTQMMSYLSSLVTKEKQEKVVIECNNVARGEDIGLVDVEEKVKPKPLPKPPKTRKPVGLATEKVKEEREAGKVSKDTGIGV